MNLILFQKYVDIVAFFEKYSTDENLEMLFLYF